MIRTVLIACLLTIACTGTAQANTQFLLMQCERQEAACNHKCAPEVKVVPGKSGHLEKKLDGKKLPSCQSKCITAANKCRAKANEKAASEKVLPSCTTTAQCGESETCYQGRCVAM